MDITKAQRQFFAKLASFDELLKIFDLLPDHSFFVKDRRGRFVALNKRGREYCGVDSIDEAFNKTDHDFFPKQRADEYRADDVAVMDSCQPIVNRIESAPEGEGSPRLVITSKIPLRDARGRVVGVAGFSRSIEQFTTTSGSASAFARTVEYIHMHFDEKLTSQRLAEIAGLSASQLERRFRHSFGCSSRQYLMRVRIENATRMLADSDDSISTVAQSCGFFDHAHFNRAFRRQMAISPSKFRKTHRPPAKH